MAFQAKRLRVQLPCPRGTEDSLVVLPENAAQLGDEAGLPADPQALQFARFLRLMHAVCGGVYVTRPSCGSTHHHDFDCAGSELLPPFDEDIIFVHPADVPVVMAALNRDLEQTRLKLEQLRIAEEALNALPPEDQ